MERIVTVITALTLAACMTGAFAASATSPPTGLNYADSIQYFYDRNLGPEAVMMMKKGSAAGDAAAEYLMGHEYLIGTYVKPNIQKAMYWFRKSAEQKNADAENALGSEYVLGQRVPANPAQAYYWYEKSAHQGNDTGIFNLGLFYFFSGGEIVPRDHQKAGELMRLAAKHGDDSAKNFLVLYPELSSGSTQPYAPTPPPL